jgi:hypothetical protein
MAVSGPAMADVRAHRASNDGERSGVGRASTVSPSATKSGLLRALWDLLLKGDTHDAPVADRSW